VVAIGAACAASLLFSFQRNWFIGFADHKRRKVVTATTSLVLQLLILAPFIVSGWAVKAYVRDVGLAAFILTGVFAGCAVFIWFLQTSRVEMSVEVKFLLMSKSSQLKLPWALLFSSRPKRRYVKALI
jgi:hypothetical protein